MITVELLAEKNDNVNELANNLSASDIDFLVNVLDEKRDQIRYSAFLILQKRSEEYNDVFPYWDKLVSKMSDNNSYHRSIGIMLIAENVRWDSKNKFDEIIKEYLSHCHDEKFITSRQAIQSIKRWINYRPDLSQNVNDVLMAIDVGKLKDTQQKLIRMDILEVLLSIQKIKPAEQISEYVNKVIAGGYLDKKSVGKIEKMM